MPGGELREHTPHAQSNRVHADRSARDTANLLPHAQRVVRGLAPELPPPRLVGHLAPYGSRYTRMSTSLRRSAGSMATRNVIGWSLPSTFPMAAKPSSESARDTRSTLTVSTRSVSARAPGPNTRAIEAATFAGGAAGVCTASRTSASAMLTSELVAHAEAQDFELAHARRVAQQLVVALERGVPGGFVGEAERRDAARQRPVPRHAGGDARLCVAHADVRDHGAQRKRSAVVARVRRDERHRSPEGPGADRGIRVRRPSIPE